MRIQDHLSLFTVFEKEKPEDDSYYICVTLDKKSGTPHLAILCYSIKWGCFRSASIKRKNVFAWLDFSKLTTKTKAKMMAEDCHQNYDIAWLDLMNEHKNSL